LRRGGTKWLGLAADSGGRSDQWRFAVQLPPLLQTLDKAAGLDHRELTVRSIWLPGGAAEAALADRNAR
jgi:hypothetical protein